LDDSWYDFYCKITGNEIVLESPIDTNLCITQFYAYSKLQEGLPEEVNTLGYTPFETENEEEEAEETTPPHTNKCSQGGLFGLNGVCYTPSSTKIGLKK
jgi:hypothetical protein